MGAACLSVALAPAEVGRACDPVDVIGAGVSRIGPNGDATATHNLCRLAHGLGGLRRPAMQDVQPPSPHLFHIPVMGTGFSIDTPLRVARWGISSVVSLVDDHLIEKMRRHHAVQLGRPYEEIGQREPDARARRITAYLDLLHDVVTDQMSEVRASPFEADSLLDGYFRKLPDGALRRRYLDVLTMSAGPNRTAAEDTLRAAIVPGSIDVNIMTKVDRRTNPDGSERPNHESDALTALRGFVRSKVSGAVVFSAGLNQRLFAYAAELGGFFPNVDGALPKRIILKVSDFRSARVQGRFLARLGLWVSEYRIESGLNCGGHAFATQGLVLGPILDAFRDGRDALLAKQHATWVKAHQEAGRAVPDEAPSVRVTVQGGIGTGTEANLLHERYGVDGTGWGTSFLLVPEVTRVDAATRARLLAARQGDVRRGPSSPLGIPFWSLVSSGSENIRRQRIAEGRPGSPCPHGYLVLGGPGVPDDACPASRKFLRSLGPDPDPDALAKACICHDLASGALLELGIEKTGTPAICPGPEIVHYRALTTFEDMVDRIYDRSTKDSTLAADRPHMFVSELLLYIEEWETQVGELPADPAPRAVSDLDRFRQNLIEAIEHYHHIVDLLPARARPVFVAGLRRASARLHRPGASDLPLEEPRPTVASPQAVPETGT